MVLGADPELQTLSQKIESAAAQNPEWLMEYVKKHDTSAGPLPFHPNLGVSAEEYERYLELVDGGITLQQVGNVSLKVVEIAGGGLRLLSLGDEFPLHEVELYPSRGYIETVYGRLSREKRINQTDSESPTGAWNGVQWVHEEFDGKAGSSVKFAIGKRDDHGDGIIYYDVKYLIHPDLHQFSFIILYPLR